MEAQSPARLSAEGWDHDPNQGRHFSVLGEHTHGGWSWDLSNHWVPCTDLKQKPPRHSRYWQFLLPNPNPIPSPAACVSPRTCHPLLEQEGQQCGSREHRPWSQTAWVQIPIASLRAVWLLRVTQRLCTSFVQNEEINRTSAAGLWSQGSE